MTGKDLWGLGITAVLGGAMVVMAIFLLLGKGAWLIAGYNTASPEEKAQYDEKALCRFMGKVLLPIGLATPLLAVGGILGIRWLHWAYLAGVVALAVFAAVWCNTGGRFRK